MLGKKPDLHLVRAEHAAYEKVIGTVIAVVRGQFPPAEAASFDNEIGPSLKPIEAVVAGTKNDPDLQRTRLFIRIP